VRKYVRIQRSFKEKEDGKGGEDYLEEVGPGVGREYESFMERGILIPGK